MRHHIEYSYGVQVLFFQYLKDSDLETLIKGLRNIENHVENTFEDVGEKSLWFKMTEDDTLSRTIGNINADLSLPPNHPNHILMVNDMKMACDLYGDMQIYFS